MSVQLNSDFLFVIAGALALVFMLVAYFGWRAAFAARRRAQQLEVELASLGNYSEQIDGIKVELQEALDARVEAEKQVSVAQEKVASAEQRMKDWEKQREESIQAARASVMQAGQELSSKLLEDHKREMVAAKKENEQLAKKTTDELTEKFTTLTKSVAAIQDRAQHNSQQMETVMRALTNPSGAGQMAEVGLENSLKDLGLEKDRDFVLQYHVAGEESNLRPDAVLFLPQDLVMVIDCKASKFMIELADAEGSDSEDAVMARLLGSAHAHLDALGRKQYADAVARMLTERGRKLGRLLNVMYLPSDAMLEKLRKADGGLLAKAEKHGIILAGPASLAGLFSLAKQQIAAAKQDENQQKIIAMVREVMDSFATALSHVDGIGRGVKTSADKLDAFARSINSRLLPKLRNLESLGVAPAKNKAIPHAIASYEVRRSDEVMTIDAEAEDDAQNALAIEDKKTA